MIIVAAMTRKRVIGKDNALPWNIPEEMKHFRELTKDSTVIMGRKTFESIGNKPLPNRKTIVISHSLKGIAEVDICSTKEDAIAKAESYGRQIFILGGSQIYREFLPLVSKMYISYIKENYKGDSYFPEFSEKDWVIEKKEDHGKFEFVVYRRK